MQVMWEARETWLYRINPSLKLAGAVAVFAALMFTDRINVLVHVTWLLLGLLLTQTGHPLKRLLWLTLPFTLLFVSSAVSMILFGKGDTLWFRYGLIQISEESFFRGIHIGLKSVDMAMSGLLFALTTRPVRLFYSLMQQLRLPPKFAYSFMAALRLLPMAADEYRTLQMALKVRGVRYAPGVRGWIARLRRAAVPLLAQSIRRAQRIAVAMEAKRFSAATGGRTYYYRVGWSTADAGYLLLLLGCAGMALWLGGLAPLFPVDNVRYHIL